MTAKQKGAEWDVILGIYPFSLQIDFTPTIDITIDAVERVVHDVLGGVPLIGDLIEGLVDSVLNALRSVIRAILAGLHSFIQQIINLIDVFSPTIPYKVTSFPAKQIFLPASGPGDREVSLSISAINQPTIINPEIVITANFA
ncbi:hypothetical protein CVM73_38520 [Bradyrhizobium forestalis]|uniref:Uncharacterized protein n=1 Tax=Bradyrhizobium forestalis TaxID=1419263 RepID=A0A2M8QWT8_9BRAD|nr:hypothetical protein CVM73_38520 [Bradyrhizobium forestalis]